LIEYAEVEAKEASVKYGGNRVKISTFHGFKGLEMPIVFVADIASPYNNKSATDDVLADGNGFIGISAYDLDKKTKSKTLSLLATKRKIKERESKEEMRLFYVALTRAKQYMYVTASLSSENRMRSFASIPKIDLPSCNLDFVSNAVLAGSLDVCTFNHLGSDSASQNTTAISNIPLLSVGGNQHLQQVIAESQKFVYPFAEATSLARKYSVSALDRVENETARIFEEAANLGTLYHRVMEHIDFNAESLEAVSLELDNMVASGILSEAERGLIVADDIVKCLSSSIMQLAKKSVCQREQEFMMYIPANETGGNFNSSDKVLVQGVVDLIIDGEECVIVDFKNSYLRDSDMLEKYKKQLNLYKRAVESAFTGKKFKIALYSFKTGQVLWL
ncbi:MAG: 3'-5' exonuclease, partial [Clostridia bacterium]